MVRIDFQNNLKWEKDATFFGNKKSWTTSATLSHFFSGVCLTILVYIVILKLNIMSNHQMITTIIISNVCHAIEDFLQNVSINGMHIGFEGRLSDTVKCGNYRQFSKIDNDSLQNYLGDISSYCVGSILGMYILKSNPDVEVGWNLFLFIVIIFILWFAWIWVYNCILKNQIKSIYKSMTESSDE